MITDRIKFKPQYAKVDSRMFADAGVVAEGTDPERLWRNLTNLSDWPRYDKHIVDVQFTNPGISDPHLYDKVQFEMDLANGAHLVAEVIYALGPKDDRTGRLAIQAAVMKDGKQVNEVVMEFIVGVPEDRSGRPFVVEAAISGKNEPIPVVTKASALEPTNFGDRLEADLRNLVEWCRKHGGPSPRA